LKTPAGGEPKPMEVDIPNLMHKLTFPTEEIKQLLEPFVAQKLTL